MYYVLCVCLCATMVLLIGAACSLLVLAVSPLLRRMTRSWPPALRAQFIFLIRLLPASAGLFVTLGIVLPAFLLHEPEHTNERLDLPLMLLAGLGLAVVVMAACRSARAWRRLEGLRRRWMRSARRLTPCQNRIEVYEVADPSTLIVVTGIRKPTVFLSRSVVESLTRKETVAAIAHELAHVSAGDNLKQLLLQATKLPFFDQLSGLDREWRMASELAADEIAIRSGTPVLELASALVKVARLRVPRPLLPEGAVSCFLPPGKDSMLATRVEYLKSLLERGGDLQPDSRVAHAYLVAAALAIAAFSAVLLHPSVFLITHSLLEKLV